MNNKFSKRVRDIQVSAIKQMPLLARAIPNTVSLGQGIPALLTPQYIREQVIARINDNEAIGKYSLQPGLPELKNAVAKKVSAKAGRPVDAESEIFISAGGMEALLTAILSVVERGDEVILFDPSYSSHIEQVLLAEGAPVFVALDEKKNWALDERKLERAITKKTKAIIVCDPVNPTGKVFSAEELNIIARLAKADNLFVIADETYDFLVYDSTPYKSLTAYPEIKNQVIACYSFSKEYAMTGWRVGYMYAPADVVAQALKVHDAAVICAPTISQYAALAALTGLPDEGRKVKEVLSRRREQICRRLDRLPDLFFYNKPMGAYYILARYLKTKLNSWDFAVKLLNETGVITIPGRAFGPSAEGCIRMSFGGTAKEINEAFDRVEKWNRALI